MSHATQQSDSQSEESVLSNFEDPRTGTRQITGDKRRHRDSDSIRRHFGVAPFDGDEYQYPVLPDLLTHTWDASERLGAGGTDLLATGKPGKGKSTQALHFATRLMEINSEEVVWRGSPSRSEWLPLSPWTRLCLPSGVDLDISLEPRDPTDDRVEISVDELEDIVRSVEFYRNPVDLNQRVLSREETGLGGRFNVVYPDPRMRGCQDLLEGSRHQKGGLEFTEEDPNIHWWFAWALARVDRGPHHWMTWICDEVGDLCPQSAQKDEFATYQKVELLKDIWVDARKHGLSVFAWGHSEVDIHQLIRHKMRWRVSMPGKANPTTGSGVVGFGSVPMHHDLTSSMGLGRALLFTEEHFQRFRWPDYSAAPNFKLKIRCEQ